MDKTQVASKRLVWAIIGVAVIVFVLISVILYILFGTAPNDEDRTNTQTEISSSSGSIASQREIRDDLSSLEDALRQAKIDRNKASEALNDDKNQVKLSE